MIKPSLSETKWSSLLAGTRALILYISIWIFDFGPEKLPGLSRNGPLVTTCTSLLPCKMKFSTSSIKEKLPVLFYFNARKIQNNVSKVIPSPLTTLLITSTQREFRDHLKAKRTLKSLGLEVLRTTNFQNEWELVTMKITFVVLSSGDNSR